VAAWLAAAAEADPDRRVAWLSLDSADSRPDAFWRNGIVLSWAGMRGTGSAASCPPTS